MKTKTTRRILAALITIPIAISLTGCGGQDSKKSEPKKPAVTSSQSVKAKKAAKEKARAEAKAKQEAEVAAKAQAPAAQQPATSSGNKPAVQQPQRPAAPAPARRAPQQPARQYQAPAKPAYQKPATNSGNTGGGYQPKPYETYITKEDANSHANDGKEPCVMGDEYGNVINTWC